MDTILDYKCPNCGGSIKYNAENGQFQCESCDSSFTKEQLEKYAKMLDSASEESNYTWESAGNGETLDGMCSYICKSCGAEIIVEETASATQCPYCGNTVVLAGQLSGMNKPDAVIPFKLTKDAARNALKSFYKGKLLLPSVFKSENKLKEMQAVYVPFWLFDCDADANVVFEATNTRRWSDSSYDYTEVSYYNAFRSGSLGFTNIPVDGSEKMDDTYMEGLEPFDYSEMTEFNPAYLSGFAADKYDVDAESSFPRAEKRIEASVAGAFSATVMGYDSVTCKQASVVTQNGSYKYALLPVWMMTSEYKGKRYIFAVNGQTGRVSGELPVDKMKRALLFGGITAVIMAIAQFFIF